jgi:PAS domain S-box-containing protein
LATSAERTAPTRPAPDLDDFFENGTVGLHLVGPDGTIIKANPADYAPLGYSAEEYVGRNIIDFHADRAVIDDILARLTRGERLERYPARLRAKDGSIRDVEISSSVRFECGEFVNTRCFTVDITDQKRVEAALREAEKKLAATFESAVAGIAEVDAEGRFLRINEAFCRLSGYDRDEIANKSFFDFTHPADVPAERERWRALVAGEVERFTIEKRYVRRDGRVVWIEVMNSAVRGPHGGFAYGVKMLLDVTERREADARQKLLLDELNHRVKNTLATVQSIAAQTFRNTGIDPAVQRVFEGRLITLSNVHGILTQQSWDSADLHDVVWSALRPHGAPDRERFTVEGPALRLDPKSAVALSMAVHELCTNAIKYGALSTEAGHVDVRWSVAADRLRWQWRESGGPAVTAPTRTGFGSRMIERALAMQLSGQVAIAYEPAGVICTIDAPLAAIRDHGEGERPES